MSKYVYHVGLTPTISGVSAARIGTGGVQQSQYLDQGLGELICLPCWSYA